MDISETLLQELLGLLGKEFTEQNQIHSRKFSICSKE